MLNPQSQYNKMVNEKTCFLISVGGQTEMEQPRAPMYPQNGHEIHMFIHSSLDINY